MINKSINRRPKVSIVMSVYNSRQYLREAINSVLGQTLSDFEFIIIDDGSIDDSVDIVLSYDDARICLISQENTGLAAALNRGIQLARSELIARMDSDDISLPNRLMKQVQYMEEHPEVVCLGTAAVFMDEEGNDICLFSPSDLHQNLINTLPGSPFIHPSVMFQKRAYIQAGKYPEYMKWGAEDAILFGRMSTIGKLSNLTHAYIKYRLVPGSASRKPADFRALLLDITRDALANKTIDELSLKQLSEKSKNIDRSMALVDYNFELAKLYLWSGGDAKQARVHLGRCLGIESMWIKVNILKLISYLPSWLVSKLYSLLRSQKIERV